MRVSVDPDVCTASGQCTAFVPEVFAMDDAEGVARVVTDKLSPEHVAQVQDAATRCPVRAITVTLGG
jgi:ferredoxin